MINFQEQVVNETIQVEDKGILITYNIMESWH